MTKENTRNKLIKNQIAKLSWFSIKAKTYWRWLTLYSSEPPYIIMEYAGRGNLQLLLRAYRYKILPKSTLFIVLMLTISDIINSTHPCLFFKIEVDKGSWIDVTLRERPTGQETDVTRFGDLWFGSGSRDGIYFVARGVIFTLIYLKCCRFVSQYNYDLESLRWWTGFLIL